VRAASFAADGGLAVGPAAELPNRVPRNYGVTVAAIHHALHRSLSAAATAPLCWLHLKPAAAETKDVGRAEGQRRVSRERHDGFAAQLRLRSAKLRPETLVNPVSL